MSVFRPLAILILLLAVAGCARVSGTFDRMRGGQSEPAPAVAAQPPEARPETDSLTSGARTADDFDTTTAEERAAATATAPSGGRRELGRTIASLGDPTDPGFWAETGLVTSAQEGRLSYPASGKTVTVELRPSGTDPAAGSRVSLAAFRALEAPLTDLPELIVIGNPG
ncbi:hypothetical protein [Actibacterium sp. 188UL27-1]|uniref:hypothetical protein n=1 Tax=Actibacterium sp. 188UL27-1 TaxID=2786961 RepID=UPI00195E30BC|nr:hypothetical protein [Actibacterium sp. 188UL27-1]MBM7067792.1 hypothetical protein [Actibacterium sp. 188UL27-1]